MQSIEPYIIETNNLTKLYNGVNALSNLDLRVKKNSIFGFLGPNGAGKTTTIKLLLGLISPTGGNARIFGHDISDESINIRAQVGYLPQNPNFYENMTAREVLEFSIKFFYSGPENELKNRVDEVIEIVELEEKADRPIKGFSGGERQRLGIAQSVVHKPKLLILDEPTASLDPIGRYDVLKLMSKLRKETTIFYSTHILDDVQKVSDTVAILNRGKVVAQGPIEELLAGTEGIVFSIKLKNPSEKIKINLQQKSWVANVQEDSSNHHSIWYITVTDEDKAEQLLLREILSDNNIKVLEFHRKKYELEDIFLQVIEEDENVEFK